LREMLGVSDAEITQLYSDQVLLKGSPAESAEKVA
jgi:hypothetical protein